MTTPTNSDAELRQDIEFIIHPANKDGLASMQDDVIAIATAWRDRCVAEARRETLADFKHAIRPLAGGAELGADDIKRVLDYRLTALSPTTGEGKPQKP